MNGVDLTVYPDTECTALREALADRTGVSTEQILVGNGSTELIHLAARDYLNSGDRAAIFSPTFGEFEAACDMQSVSAIEISAHESDVFAWDIPDAVRVISDEMPSLVFLCNPNNPTGRYLSEVEVRLIAEALPNDSLLLLDERTCRS